MATPPYVKKSHGLELAGDSKAYNFALEERAIDGSERNGQIFIDSATGDLTMGIPDGVGGIKTVGLADLDDIPTEALAEISGDVEALTTLLSTIQALAATNAGDLDTAETERAALGQSLATLSTRISALEAQGSVINDAAPSSETSTLSAKTINASIASNSGEAYRQAME